MDHIGSLMEESSETPTRPPSPHGLPSAKGFQHDDADEENEGMDEDNLRALAAEYCPAVTKWLAAGDTPRRYTKFPDEFLSDEQLATYYHSPESAIANGTPTRAQEVLVSRALYPARRTSRHPNRKEIVVQKKATEILSQSPLPPEVRDPSGSRDLSQWQRERIHQLLSAIKMPVAEPFDKEDDGFEADAEDIITGDNDKELD